MIARSTVMRLCLLSRRLKISAQIWTAALIALFVMFFGPALAQTYNEGRLFAYVLRIKDPTFVAGYGGAELDPALLILQEAFRKTYLDPEFQKEYKNVTRDDPSPLLPENHEKAIREIPRDPEVIEVFNELIDAGPLPTRH